MESEPQHLHFITFPEYLPNSDFSIYFKTIG